MTRRRAVAVALKADHGPEIVLKRGERVVADIPDIERPEIRDRTVRATKVRCLYADLWADGELTHGQREAADRVAIQSEAVIGAAGGGVGGSPGWLRSTLPERVIKAAGDLRMAAEWLGPKDYRWMAAVVVWNRWPEDRVDVGRLSNVLQVLAERFGMD